MYPSMYAIIELQDPRRNGRLIQQLHYTFRVIYTLNILFISYNKGVEIFESYIFFVVNMYDSNILFVSYNIRSEYCMQLVYYIRYVYSQY